MFKRVNLSNEKPPAKRARGFRLARNNPDPTIPATSSSSLFVTVNAEEHNTGTLKAQSRLLSRTIDSSPLSLSSTPQTTLEPQNEPQNEDTLLSSEQMEVTENTSQPGVPPKAKRKRHTTNVVCSRLPFLR